MPETAVPRMGMVIFSFALIEKEPNSCNIRLALEAERVDRQHGPFVKVSQWEVALKLASDGVELRHVVQLPADRSTLPAHAHDKKDDREGRVHRLRSSHELDRLRKTFAPTMVQGSDPASGLCRQTSGNRSKGKWWEASSFLIKKGGRGVTCAHPVHLIHITYILKPLFD